MPARTHPASPTLGAATLTPHPDTRPPVPEGTADGAVLPPPQAAAVPGIYVNDRHSRLNPTRVRDILRPTNADELAAIVDRARLDGIPLSVGGGWHAMGAQQFGRDALLLDTTRMAAVGALDRERGLVEVEAGVMWPALIDALRERQRDAAAPWSIRQKQTGADRLSLGGAVSANAHGRGLTMQPIVDDVESLTLVGADGVVRRCSRDENAGLFSLAVGGYGLVGAIATVTLRLAPLRKLRRTVVEVESDGLIQAFDQRIAAGFQYGDFQFSIDPGSPDFLHRGILSAYEPVAPDTPIAEGQRHLSPDDWRELLYLAHVDKSAAYARYVSHYVATSGQVYWSDTHQLATYVDDYHLALDARMGSRHPGSEMITELYVPRPALGAFLADVRSTLREERADVVYGTIRLIERDGLTVLAWAREPWACMILNLHVDHSSEGIARSGDAFRALIDVAAAHGGSFFLTYHRHATREQLLGCHPRLPEFLRAKREHDPAELFQSEWYRHHRALFSAGR